MMQTPILQNPVPDSGTRPLFEWLTGRESAHFTLLHQLDTANEQLPTVNSSYADALIQRPVSRSDMEYLDSVASVCRILIDWGAKDVAERLAYLASDEDQEDGDVPATLESVRGFLEFFGQVEHEGILNLTCSPEGWICAEWDFDDGRSVGLWFLDFCEVIFVATESNGDFVDIHNGDETGERQGYNTKISAKGVFCMDSDEHSQRQLSSYHNVARYCRPKSLRPTDGLPSRDAFLLRPREEYLSTNWLEYFHESERDVQLGNVRNLLSVKLAIASNGRLAVLNAGVAVALCQGKEQVDVRFFHSGRPR